MLLLGLALVGAQSPVTVGNGQYCSNYYGGSTDCDWTNDYYNPDQEGDSSEVCAPGGYCCIWAYGTGCSFVQANVHSGGGRRRLLQSEYSSYWNCAAGCVTAASCTAIPNAYFTGPASPVTTATACPFQCNAGYAKSGSACVLTGTTTKAATTSTTAAPATTPLVCPAGKYLSSGQCGNCSAGTYTSGTGFSVCANCSVGLYSNASSSSCSQCSVGYYSNATASSACKQCQAGSYSNSSQASVCSNCQAGGYTNATQATVCLSCQAGYYVNSTQATVCLACQAGSYINSTQATACLACQAGSYINNTQATACLACQAGSYINNTQGTVCLACQAGSYINNTQATV